MALAVIKRKNSKYFLCNRYDSGYYYSEYTHEPSSYNEEFSHPDDFLNAESECRLIIFEAEDAARRYINLNKVFCKDCEVLPLFESGLE